MVSTFSEINNIPSEFDYNKMTFEFFNVPLSFAFDALEPNIDGKTMEVHHNGLLQRYIGLLNATLKPYPQFHSWTLRRILSNLNVFPIEISTQVRNFAGGVFNHFFYFEQMTPNESGKPSEDLTQLFEMFFKSFENFKTEFTSAALSVFGSGYVWLVMNPSGKLEIVKTVNQDTPFSNDAYPLLNLDVWEHAYFLKNFGNRAAYINSWFETLNWKIVGQRLLELSNLLKQKG